MNENRLIIYAQESWHQPAIIAGDRHALLALKEAIEKALTEGSGSCTTFCPDGEGYRAIAICADNSDLDIAPAPYTEDYARSETPRLPVAWDMVILEESRHAP